MGYDILSRPFDNGLVEETGIPIPATDQFFLYLYLW
jgi:hypothetical protein